MVQQDARKLVEEVIRIGKCTGCGICLGRCPYFQTIQERVAMVYSCDHEDAVCYYSCPRTETELEKLDYFTFGIPRNNHELGQHLDIFQARAMKSEIEDVVQYSGVVTALMQFALREGVISSGIMTAGISPMPRPFIARSPEDVREAAGSKYSAVPTLQALNEAAGEDMDAIGVVGRPCQILAVRKMQLLAQEKKSDLAARRVSLSIGLFCFWAFSPDFYSWLNQKTGGENIVKLDIPPGKLEVRTTEKIYSFDLDDVRPFIKQSCEDCFDSTSEFADVSVGAVEGNPRWNTLIVRTSQGLDFVRRAEKEGILELKSCEASELERLRDAAASKKFRVLTGKGADYLHLSAAYRNAVLKGGS